MAFEALSDRLGRILKKRRGQATLTEKNRDDRLAYIDYITNHMKNLIHDILL